MIIKKSCTGKKIFKEFDNISYCPETDFRQNTSQTPIKIFFPSEMNLKTPKYIIPSNFISFGYLGP